MTYQNALKLGFCFAGAALSGCGPKPDATKPTTVVIEKEGEHSHGKGPHGGVVFDLGKFHAEFTVDHVKKECVVYVLGSDEKTSQAVAAKELTIATKTTKGEDGKAVPPLTITLKPADEKDGKATKFVGNDPGLGNVAEFAGTVTGEIDGKPSKGEFKE